MKNQRLLYVLLPMVLAIWGLIFQRIWSAAAGEPEPEPANTALPHVLAGNVTAHALPKLLLNYGDPFKVMAEKAGRSLDQPANSPVAFAHSATSPVLNFLVAPVSVVVAPVVWPSLRYLGFINNLRQNSRIALLAINEQEVMLKSGDNQQSVVIANIFRDSVLVTFQGKKKTVSRVVSSSPGLYNSVRCAGKHLLTRKQLQSRALAICQVTACFGPLVAAGQDLVARFGGKP